MRRETASGTLLIIGSLLMVLVMATHPTGHQMVTPEGGHRLIALNMTVHGLAIASVPLLFIGLLGLQRRLGHSDLTAAALVFYGFAGVAVMSAALTSGFVASGVIHEFIGAAEGAERDLYGRLLEYTHFFNQGYAGVHTFASCVAIALWSMAMLKSGRMGKPVAWAGIAVGSLIAVFFVLGHLRLDVHGFGIITVAQSAWLIWVGILLLKDGPAQAGAA